MATTAIRVTRATEATGGSASVSPVRQRRRTGLDNTLLSAATMCRPQKQVTCRTVPEITRVVTICTSLLRRWTPRGFTPLLRLPTRRRCTFSYPVRRCLPRALTACPAPTRRAACTGSTGGPGASSCTMPATRPAPPRRSRTCSQHAVFAGCDCRWRCLAPPGLSCRAESARGNPARSGGTASAG